MSFLRFFVSRDHRDTKRRLLMRTSSKLDELYPLPVNDQITRIAEQFRQNPFWELGNLPIVLTEAQQSIPNTCTCDCRESRAGPGVYKNGHLYAPTNPNPYRINHTGVHPRTTHHIFLIRHGLYFYTEDESTAHLLRYGKYQTRMAGHKINKKIHELIQTIGPLTRPIKLVSSTQVRAIESLYNIRLQLDNQFSFEPDVIQDTGLRECIDTIKQRKRWYYFVREYLQPPQTDRPEHTVTIIAGHGNLFTAFDHIIRRYFARRRPLEEFLSFSLPTVTTLSHGQTLLYRTVGAEIPKLVESVTMNEIPITVNHAVLRKDFYYEWAAMHQCRFTHAQEEMRNYIHTSVLDHVFAVEAFPNRIRNYNIIVYMEMKLEYTTHLVPMMHHICRRYLHRLSLIQANTDFGSFNRLGSPIPVPSSVEEQRAPFTTPLYQFSPYGMPFPVDNSIQKFRENPILTRGNIPRDDKASYLTRLGINQIRGIMSQIHKIILKLLEKLPGNIRMFPVKIVSDPTIQSAESCFHTRSLLLGANYSVSEQTTDLGLLHNYFQKKAREEFMQFQRVQILHMLRTYLTPDTSDATRPSLKIHILCGEGRLFTAFRQEIASSNFLIQPHERFTTVMGPELNALNHGESIYFETIGPEIIKLHDSLSLLHSGNIPEEQRIPTTDSLQLTSRDFKYWMRNRDGPCTLSYFLSHKERLSLSVVSSSPLYHSRVARLIKQEWNPYLAGLFLYSCRVQLTLLNGNTRCAEHSTAAVLVNQTFVEYDRLSATRAAASAHGF
ncbi:unnamed protein product [Rotaria socialis]|uniref:Uncharacterized protein n=1 Tax=Rotaria socialis TaxID=392032 RepID=A0A820U2J9_9BILA|nr:unnamed protein product [Rotaria socialis]